MGLSRSRLIFSGIFELSNMISIGCKDLRPFSGEHVQRKYRKNPAKNAAFSHFLRSFFAGPF